MVLLYHVSNKKKLCSHYRAIKFLKTLDKYNQWFRGDNMIAITYSKSRRGKYYATSVSNMFVYAMNKGDARDRLNRGCHSDVTVMGQCTCGFILGLAKDLYNSRVRLFVDSMLDSEPSAMMFNHPKIDVIW